MILHTLNASPASAAFRDCLHVAQADDAILLMGDAVYAAIFGSPALQALLNPGAEVYLLASDAQAAGIAVASEQVQCIAIDGFVELTERYPRQQAWY